MTCQRASISVAVLASVAISCVAWQSRGKNELEISSRAELKSNSAIARNIKRNSAITHAFQKFKVHVAGSMQARIKWEKIFQQLHMSFTSSSPVAWTEYALRGQGGFCESCDADGQIYMAFNSTNNDNSGALNSVRLSRAPDQIKDAIHAIDEYQLGEDTKTFRWCGILCKAWGASVKCMHQDSERQNLWTQNKVARWAKWIEPGSNAIDIGANLGDTTVEMAIRAKETLAFEANPRASLHCQTHALLNPQLNIQVYPVAVSYEDGTMQLNVDCGGCNAGPVESREWSSTVIQVPQKRLDTLLLQEHGEDFLKKVSFIKIDTEGFDKTLLRTYKPLLNISKPTFWVEWFNPYWQRGQKDDISEGSRDLFAAIHEIGYVPLNPLTMKVVTPESRNGVFDLLLLPVEKVAQLWSI